MQEILAAVGGEWTEVRHGHWFSDDGLAVIESPGNVYRVSHVADCFSVSYKQVFEASERQLAMCIIRMRINAEAFASSLEDE